MTRQGFIAATKKSHLLFSLWYQRFLEQNKWGREFKKQLKQVGALNPAYERVLFIDPHTVNINDPQFDLVAFLHWLTEETFKPGRALLGHQPWTIVVNYSLAELNDVKRSLLRKGAVFNDGMEHIEFQPDLFLRSPVVEVGQNRKLKRVSYELRVISSESLDAVDWNDKVHTILFVSKILVPDDYFRRPGGCKLYHLAYIENLIDLKSVLA